VRFKGPLFLVDEKGRKKAVLMSYRAYVELMEDSEDLATMAERRDEEWIPFEDVLAEIENERRSEPQA
jgi:hypothetical protein